MEKDSLRKKMLLARKQFAGKKEASELICSRLTAMPVWKQATTICVYSSLPSEVDTSALMSSGKIISWTNAALYIVPGVAFDRFGNRLGRGQGFYDKLLARVTVPIIGLAFEMQLVDKVPHTLYDVPMTIVITERGVYGKTKTF